MGRSIDFSGLPMRVLEFLIWIWWAFFLLFLFGLAVSRSLQSIGVSPAEFFDGIEWIIGTAVLCVLLTVLWIRWLHRRDFDYTAPSIPRGQYHTGRLWDIMHRHSPVHNNEFDHSGDSDGDDDSDDSADGDHSADGDDK